MPVQGALAFVLHSHIPYARRAGRWPHGEEWLHEAAAESYIPLLNMLNRLLDDSVPAHVTLTLTPILLEQLADEEVQDNFRTYLQDRIHAVAHDIDRFVKSEEAHLVKLAKIYQHWYQDTLRAFDEIYRGNLVSAFRHLQQAGIIEIATCAATHGYLPLLGRDESIELQLRTAVESYKRHFGHEPRVIWLPECAYRPGYKTEADSKRVGLESLLARYGFDLFFAETHMVVEGGLVGYDAAKAKKLQVEIPSRSPDSIRDNLNLKEPTTFKPYFVGSSDVAVLARNKKSGLQVWSAEWGYPGDFYYREFHKKDGISGMRYWRITGSGVDLGDKEFYHPERAASMIEKHASHFTELVHNELDSFHKELGGFGIIAANFDTELFGHWWFEGVDWLEEVLRRLAQSKVLELTTASTFIREHPPQRALTLLEGSWGDGGTHSVWDNDNTYWMWQIIHEAENRMAAAVTQFPAARGVKRLFLDQAARELLLLQSSDWPFLITTAQAGKYAVRRFLQHVDRFFALLKQARRKSPDRSILEDIWERDKIFPEIDYRWFDA